MDSETLLVKRNKSIEIPKNLSVVKCWNIIAPEIVKEVCSDFKPVPYLADTEAYKVGNIFAPTGEQVKCYSKKPICSVLGPLSQFVDDARTSAVFFQSPQSPIKASAEKSNFQGDIEDGKDHLVFTGYNYHFLNKPQNLDANNNIAIRRSAHEELHDVKWVGLITDIVEADSYQFNILRKGASRELFVGEHPNTIFIKYDICEVDELGVLSRARTDKFDKLKWQPLTAEQEFPVTTAIV